MPIRAQGNILSLPVLSELRQRKAADPHLKKPVFSSPDKAESHPLIHIQNNSKYLHEIPIFIFIYLLANGYEAASCYCFIPS